MCDKKGETCPPRVGILGGGMSKPMERSYRLELYDTANSFPAVGLKTLKSTAHYGRTNNHPKLQTHKTITKPTI